MLPRGTLRYSISGVVVGQISTAVVAVWIDRFKTNSQSTMMVMLGRILCGPADVVGQRTDQIFKVN